MSLNTGRYGHRILSKILPEAEFRRRQAGAIFDNNWKPLDWCRHDWTQDHPHCWIELAVNEFRVSTAAPNGSTILSHREHRARVAVRRVLARAPHVDPASLLMRLFLVRTFAAVFSIWARNMGKLQTVKRYSKAHWLMFMSDLLVEAEMLCKWNTRETVFDILGWSRHFLQ